MGNLVFQAPLGGQVNLVGPNTASTYNLNVPTVNATLATTDANTFTAAQTISSGNLIFSGTGQKVTGDYSNATLTSRAAFQSSTSNGSTGIYALPNGTSTAASWQATNAADPTNASKILIATNGSTDVQLVSGRNGSGTYLPLTFYTNGSEQMRLDTSGNLGLGVTPNTWTNSFKALQFGNSGALTYQGGTNAFWLGSNWYYNAGDKYIASDYATLYSQQQGKHIWWTAASGTANAGISFTQAMTLDSSGNLLVGTTSTQSGSQFRVYQASGSSSEVVDFSNNNATYTGVVQYNRMTATGSTSNYLFAGQSNNADKIYIYGNGNIVNSNNSYGSLSDVKLKENITDATPKLAGLLQVRVVNYNLKTEPEHKQLGVIAQELEQVFPSMIDESPDRDSEGNDLGTTTKSVKYSVFVPMLIKAIQEQQAIITQLQADVAALKG